MHSSFEMLNKKAKIPTKICKEHCSQKMHVNTKRYTKLLIIGVPIVAQWVKNPTSVHEDAGLIAGFTQWVKEMQLGSGIAVAVV